MHITWTHPKVVHNKKFTELEENIVHNWVVEGVSLPQMVQVHALHCLTLSPHCLIHDLDRKNFRCHYHTNYQSQTSVDKGFSPAHFTVCGSKNSSHMITFCGSAVCKKVAFNERKLKVSRQSCIMWLVLWKPQSSKKIVITWPDLLSCRLKQMAHGVSWEKPLSTDIWDG